MRKLDAGTAAEIWAILVEHCGAAKSDDARYQFITMYSRPSVDNFDRGAPREYRFGGKYGMAGKFWWNNDRFYVNGHSRTEVDEETLEREHHELEEVNALLAEVYRRFERRRLLTGMLETIPAYNQFQGPLKDQLVMLQAIANKVGLHDAADLIRRQYLDE